MYEFTKIQLNLHNLYNDYTHNMTVNDRIHVLVLF